MGKNSELQGCSNRYKKKFIHTVVATTTDKDTWFLRNIGSFTPVTEWREDGFICDVLSSHQVMSFLQWAVIILILID